MEIEAQRIETGCIYMSIGYAIRALRMKRNMTVKQVCAKSGLPAMTVYQIETQNVHNPGVLTVKKIANALDISVSQLLAENDNFKELEIKAIPLSESVFLSNFMKLTKADKRRVRAIVRLWSNRNWRKRPKDKQEDTKDE